MRHIITVAAVAALSLAAGCGRSTPTQQAEAPAAPPAWSVDIEPLASPATGESLGPQFSTSSRGAILSWIERTDTSATLKFAERTADGWSAPATVATGARWFLSDADVPTVFRAADGTLVANWLPEIDASLEAYGLLLSYSDDNGKTWAKPFYPYTDKTMTQHGFASFFDTPDNGVGLVWLDARAQELDTTSPEGGATALRAAFFDANWKQTGEQVVDARACDCCQTTAAATADGVLVGFRDRSDKDIRDIRVTRLAGGKWQEGPLVHEDGWEIHACPVNGPSLSASGMQVAAAWFTAKGDQGHAYAAFSTDAGHTWGAPIRLDDATSTGKVDVKLLEDGSAVASWIEFANQSTALKLRRIDPSGMRSAAVTVATRPGSFPRLARVGNDLLVAWTEGGGAPGTVQALKTAVARLPK
jgi:hypothetical protein